MPKPTKKERVADARALVTDVPGACAMLDECKDGIYEKIRSGQLQSYRDGKMRRITIASIKQLVARRAAEPFTPYRHPKRKGTGG